MDNEKFNLVLDKILEKTIQGRLEWETTANENTFLAVLQDSTISITRGYYEFYLTPPSGKELYIFDFRNENGSIVESIEVSFGEDKNYEKATRIYDLARQQSSTIDKNLDHILEQLAA